MGWSTSAVSLRTSPNNLICTRTSDTSTTANDLVVSLPGAATVLKAYLYWANDSVEDARVRLTTASASTVIDASQTWDDTLTIGGASIPYRGYRADVTSVVTGSDTYRFGSLNSSATLPFNGACLAGAQLIVVYEVPVGTANALTSVDIFDGFEGMRGSSSPPSSVTLPAVALSDISRAIITTMVWQGNSTSESTNYTDLLTLNGTSFGGTDANNGSGANKDNTTGFNGPTATAATPLSVYAVDTDTWDATSVVGAGSGLTVQNQSLNTDYIIIQGFVLGLESGTVTIPPEPSKAFSPDSIAPGGTSTLTITLTNTDTGLATLTSALTDSLPTGVTVDSPTNASTTCGAPGLSMVTAGDASITLQTGSTIPASDSCTITVNVTSSTSGTETNTIAAGALVTDLGANTTPATDDLTVTIPPEPSKAFSPDSIAPGGTSTLTITLTNTDTGLATLISALTDSFLPTGVTVDSPTNASTSCGGTGLAMVTAGDTSVTLQTGSTIPASGSCTVIVNVTSSALGTETNTIAAGDLQTNFGSNSTIATADLIVAVPLVADIEIVKTLITSAPYFSGDTLTYTILVTNNGPDEATAVVVNDLSTGLIATVITAGIGSNEDAGDCGNGDNTFPCTITDMALNDTVTLTMTSNLP